MAQKLSDIFTSLKPVPFNFTSMRNNSMPQSTPATLFPSNVPFTPVNRDLPNGGGSYSSPVVAQPTKPVAPAAPATVVPQAGVPSPTQPAGVNYDKYRNPVTGAIMSPGEYADYVAQRVTGGSVPNYAGNSLTQGPQTSQQLESTAADLNNQRNDIATGATDPYNVASKSGVAYSPTELNAIEKAYAGIYDPALKDVFSKLDKKQKDEATAADLKNQLALQAQKHKDDIELKRTPTAAESAAASLSSSGSGPYVVGANPTVDAWAQRIYDGNSKITDIPASDKGLRNAVTVALNANGNQANGKPTTSALGVQALATANDLLTKLNAGSGSSAVGASRIFGGGALTSNIPGTAPSNFVNDFNTLKSQLSLDAVKYLKGQGAVSDAERALLSSAVTKLSLSQSDDEFKKTLTGIIDKLNGGIEAPADSGFTVTDPDGGVHSFPSQQAADEFKKAIGQ